MRKKNNNKLIIKDPKTYINKNIIFSFRYSNYSLSSKEKIQSITPNFVLFLNIYSKNIKKHDKKFPNLKIDDIQIIRPTNRKNIFYKFVFTQPYNNHPFLIYGNLNDNFYKIMMPFGEKIGQSNINIFSQYVDYLDIDDIIAMYTLLNRTINIRKKNIIQNPKFSIINCENIKGCYNKQLSLKKKNLPNRQKKILLNQNEDQFKLKGLEVLKKYFDLLEIKEYDSAEDFLTGKKGKYSNQTRIDNFFKNKKTIMGHLKIFISLYQIQNKLIEKIT